MKKWRVEGVEGVRKRRSVVNDVRQRGGTCWLVVVGVVGDGP